MKVRGIDGMTLGDLIRQVRDGGRFVVFHCCVGLGVATWLWPSAVYFVRPGTRTRAKGIAMSLATLLLGWWAIPPGPAKAWRTLWENLAGGRDVTAQVLKALAETEEHRPTPADHIQPRAA